MTTQQFGGQWTVEKLGILRRYLDAYTTALKNQPFSLTYVDAFAGAGVWSPRTGLEYGYVDDDYAEYREVVKGSAAIALEIGDKPFDRLVFMETNAKNTDSLRELRAAYPDRNIEIINEDCNSALPELCLRLGDFDRAVVFLDPFATEVDWRTVEAIADTQKVDYWILFPINRISRSMPTGREPYSDRLVELDRVFGGREHWDTLYEPNPQLNMFDSQPRQQRPRGPEHIANLYRRRLEGVFASVAKTSRILRNSTNAPLFSLFFAASNRQGARVAIKIADNILRKW